MWNNQALYDYLLEKSEEMSNEWLHSRELNINSNYSLSAAEEVTERLIEQNIRLIHTLAEAFTQTKEDTLKNATDWAFEIAADRARTDTPILDVIQNFQLFRNIFWRQILTFIEQTSLTISMREALEWSHVFHTTFDKITEKFIQEYQEIMRTRLNAQQAMINELSSPIIPIAEEIGVLPIIGEIDTGRAKWILESTMDQALHLRLSHLFIDLSGVAIVDTMVAHQIFQIIDTLKLLGVQVTLSGIRPEIAQTAVQLGLDFHGISIKSSLKEALKNIGFKK
ncbi:STAS domain-containing protein [Fictibacillus sp. Mic-4]|uniref:STAS domain-containing protein n=1 Tax=Fictibacillus sp. Mic-4 TaxID=3132826 RepID=UPI003CF60FEE